MQDNTLNFNKNLGLRIREIRKLKNIPQTELANRIGVSFQQVQKYERGVNQVSASRLHLISLALGYPLSSFIDYAEKEFISPQQWQTRMYDCVALIKDEPTQALLLELTERLALAH